MRLARGSESEWVVVLKTEGTQCRIRDLVSGDTRRVAESTLSSAQTASLQEIGHLVPDSARPPVSAIRTAPGWGVVLVVGAASPVAVRELLDATTACESDLNGLLAELEAGGVLDRTEIAGERAYELSDAGASAVEFVWAASK